MLDYYSLKERVEQQSTAIAAPGRQKASAGSAPPLPAFLELAPPASIKRVRMHAGMGERSCHAKMRIQLKGCAMPDLATLSRSFWNSAT